jgi:hypothetical protein
MNNKSLTVLITGATGGIGYALAKIFAGNGFPLFLVARNKKRLEEIKTEFQAISKTDVHILDLDLSVTGSQQTVLSYIADNKLKIGYLVNNAGYGFQGDFLESNAANYESMIYLNITALTSLTYEIGKQMKRDGFGRIMNVASVAAFQPDPHFAVYGATKAYVRSFSEAVYQEFKGSGVTVTTLSPGLTQTGFIERAGMESAGIMTNIIMHVDFVAKAGYEGMMKGKRHIIPGFAYKMMTFFSQIMPVTDMKLKMIGKAMKP